MRLQSFQLLLDTFEWQKVTCFLQLRWWQWWCCTLWIISEVREDWSLELSHCFTSLNTSPCCLCLFPQSTPVLFLVLLWHLFTLLTTLQHTIFLATRLTRLLISPSPSLAPGGELNLSAAARAKLQKEATSDAEWVPLTLPPPAFPPTFPNN